MSPKFHVEILRQAWEPLQRFETLQGATVFAHMAARRFAPQRVRVTHRGVDLQIAPPEASTEAASCHD